MPSVGLSKECSHQPGRRAGLHELQLAHQDIYTVLFGSNPASRSRIDPTLLSRVRLCRLACGGVGVDSDTAWHTAGHTAHAARLAAGCVIDLSIRVLVGQCPNGFAIVRPPGHHAEVGQAMGFCYFNSIAVAAKRLQFLSVASLLENLHSNSPFEASKAVILAKNESTSEKPDFPLAKRILILDWDIHHGNGTQSIFYTDPSVLYISLHRHDDGYFFPGTGSIEEMGFGPGLGYTINIAWPNGVVIGDAEYLTAFRCIILPVIEEYQPDIILVSAGFDATSGHPATLGGYTVSPACFGWMTRLLAKRKLVLALEGGYELTSLCQSVEACVKALLISSENVKGSPSGKKLMRLAESERQRLPLKEAVDCMIKVCESHAKNWTSLRNMKHPTQFMWPVSDWLNFNEEEPISEEEVKLNRNSFKKQSKFDEDDLSMSSEPLIKLFNQNDNDLTNKIADLKVTNTQ